MNEAILRTRVALVGCGDISALHLDALDSIDGVEIAAVCDIDESRRNAVAAKFGAVAFADFTEMLDEIEPTVVHVCTPHYLHGPMASEALRRGINVVLEKPVAHTRHEAALLEAAARESSAKIGICFQNRYNAPVAQAMRLLGGGTLGAVRGASATVIWHRTADYYAASPWRGRWETAGGGLLMNQAIHTVDLLQWLLGRVETTSGSASTRALADSIEVEDTAEMYLTHSSGATSVFYATLGHARNSPVDIDIVTEHATLSLRGDLTVTFDDGRVEITAEAAQPEGERAYWGASHELLIRDFYASLDSPQPFWIGVAEAEKSLEIIQQVYDQSFPERAGSGIPALTTTRRANG